MWRKSAQTQKTRTFARWESSNPGNVAVSKGKRKLGTCLCAPNGPDQQEQHSHTWRHLEGWEESHDARARAHISDASHPSLSAGWEDAKLTIFHLTILLAEEKSARGCCACSRRRQRPGRLCAGGKRWGEERWGIRPPLTTPFTISRWPMRRTLTEERRWRRSDGNSCALWMLTARLPELCRIISKHCVFVSLFVEYSASF